MPSINEFICVPKCFASLMLVSVISSLNLIWSNLLSAFCVISNISLNSSSSALNTTEFVLFMYFTSLVEFGLLKSFKFEFNLVSITLLYR